MSSHPWLQTRRQIVENNYRLPPEATAEVETLFSKMEQLAMTCLDQTMFENQMSAGPLAMEYNNLLAKYAQYYVVNGQVGSERLSSMQKESAAAAAADHAKSMVEREIHTMTVQAMPEELRALKFGGLRVVPVIGPIIQWIDNIRWIRALFGRNRQNGQDNTNI